MKYCLFPALILFACICVSAAPLKRLPSTPFPADFKAWEPKRILDLSNGAIARIESGSCAKTGLEEKIQQHLAKAWGIQLPIMDVQTARSQGRPLVLIGEGCSNMVTRRLAATQRILPFQQKYEVRVIPELFDWKTGAVFLGGADAENVMEGAAILTEKFKDPAKLTFLIRCKDSKPTSATLLNSRNKSIRALYSGGKAWLPRTYAISTMNALYMDYLRNGVDEELLHYSRLLQFYEEIYDTVKGNSDRPPTFTAQMLVWQVAGLEDNPLFSAEDRARAARLIRRIGEDTMNFWEMQEPMKLYNTGTLAYLTNHPIFASRTSYFCGEYLLHRYNYEPARYWMAAAAHAMKGVEPHPIGPEDAPGYHHLCTTIFINYALASGNYDMSFFYKPSMQDYFHYTKAQWAPTMRTIGYGDTSPMGGSGVPEILAYAKDIFDDQDAKAILAMIGRRAPYPALKEKIASYGIDAAAEYPISDRYNGLLIFPLDDFRLKLRKAPLYKRPILDKAYFRSGWEGDADFLLTSGLNRSPHGHCDVNGILRYSRGRHTWLTEGHYILYPPEEHNTLSLRVNGRHYRPEARDRGALGQILNSAMTPSRKFAVTRVLSEYHGPANWVRTIVWNAKQDFWVIDELTARTDGDFLAEYRWRTLGDVTKSTPGSICVTQLPDTIDVTAQRDKLFDPAGFQCPPAPANFYIHGGDSELEMTTQAHANSSRGSGNYAFYSFAKPVVRVINSRQRATLKKGGLLRNAHFFNHTSGAEMRKLADNAWTANGQTVLLGNCKVSGIDFEGDALFAGPNGVIGFNVRKVKIGNFVRTFDTPRDLISEEPVLLAGTPGKAVEFQPAAKLDVPELTGAKVCKFSSNTCSLAAGKTGFGIGSVDGTFRVLRPDGTIAWQDTLPGPADAVCALQDRNGNEFWAVACNQVDVRPTLHLWRLYDSTGKLIKENKSTFDRVTTLFPYRDPQTGDTGFIAGYSGWMVQAFDLNGRKKWQFKCYHNMVSGAAADCDGDGKDEIMLGAGYYYHQMVTAEGKLIFQRTNAAWNHATAVCDITGDGKPEFICGRADNAVHVMTPLDQKYKPQVKPLQLGGVPQALTPYADGFAAAVENGTIVRVGQGMKILWQTDLPAGITGLAAKGDTLFTVCRDGFIYGLDQSGRIIGKYPIPVDSSSRFKPSAAAGPAGTAVISKDTLVML